MAHRRQARRYAAKVPRKIPLMNSPSLPEREADSANISSRGVYFDSNFPFQIGERVEVMLTMPEEIAGRPSRAWRCRGRVVRTDIGPAIATGVGVEFLLLRNSAAPNEATAKSALELSTHNARSH
jgi:hypothetical protein